MDQAQDGGNARNLQRIPIPALPGLREEIGEVKDVTNGTKPLGRQHSTRNVVDPVEEESESQRNRTLREEWDSRRKGDSQRKDDS